jgi:hypothetical protein
LAAGADFLLNFRRIGIDDTVALKIRKRFGPVFFFKIVLAMLAVKGLDLFDALQGQFMLRIQG